MSDYILAMSGGSSWQKIEERDLPNEAALQELIRKNPDVLPFGDLGDEVPPLLIVGRETTLPNGLVDVIAIDQDGLLTIIECKLDRNPEVKRKVIGQLLGYASYLWQMSYEQFEQAVVRKYFDSSQCHRADLRGVSLDEAMRRFREERSSGGEWTEEAFRQRLADNLKSGEFRLVIVVDKVNDELRRTVEYLNSCTAPNFQLVCAELRYFAANAVQLLVPALIGVPTGKAAPTGDGAARRKWDEAQFMADVRERWGEPTVVAAKKLLVWAESVFDYIWWGEGLQDGSFVPSLRWTADRSAKPFVVYTYGRVEVTFQYLKVYPPFDEAPKRQALLQRLNQIDGISLPEDAYDRRPYVSLQTFTDDKVLQDFIDVMAGVVAELKAARQAQADAASKQ